MERGPRVGGERARKVVGAPGCLGVPLGASGEAALLGPERGTVHKAAIFASGKAVGANPGLPSCGIDISRARLR